MSVPLGIWPKLGRIPGVCPVWLPVYCVIILNATVEAADFAESVSGIRVSSVSWLSGKDTGKSYLGHQD